MTTTGTTQDHDRHTRLAREAWEARGHELQDAFKSATEATAQAKRRAAGTRQAADELSAELKRLPSIAHDTLDRIFDGAADAFHAQVARSSWIWSIANGMTGAPIPAEWIVLHEMAAASDGKTLRDRLAESIDRAASDPQHSVLTHRADKQIRAEIAKANAVADEAEHAKTEAQRALAAAGNALRAHTNS